MVPGIEHIVYIPLALGIGFILGWKLGARQVQNAWDRAEHKRRLREEQE